MSKSNLHYNEFLFSALLALLGFCAIPHMCQQQDILRIGNTYKYAMSVYNSVFAFSLENISSIFSNFFTFSHKVPNFGFELCIFC